ncbi:MAG: M20/M25/M40 family metallo-hydrolase [Fimbriimonadales bacterium]|nr:M20/M25/M40 family metallo-hydrolase [Fimbriimonadales bacterium]
MISWLWLIALCGFAWCDSRPSLSEAIERIRDEGLNHSQVMQTLSYLTDVIGARLTGSPALLRAHEWTRDQLQRWGLQNAHLESWGIFGRGWTLKRFSAEMVEPQCMPLIGMPKAWSPGFRRPLTAEVVYIDAANPADLEKYRGKLRGKIVLSTPGPVPLGLLTEPLATRLNAEQARTQPRRRPAAGPLTSPQLEDAKYRLYLQEGVALVVETNVVGEGVAIRVMSARTVRLNENDPTRPWQKGARVPPQIVIAPEQYNRMVRMLQQGEKVKMSVNLRVEFHENQQGYNTLAEIPGTDLKDEIVMLGAHLDSWHAATGTTDNAAGVAVCMEAVRILIATGLQPRRTIRIALWGGEEQGLLGSRAYVAHHFARWEGTGDQRQLIKTPAYDRFCVYFNYDNGAGRIRGINLEGIEALEPIFAEWLQPFADLEATAISLRSTGSTDHASFNSVGLPGFQFIQDSLEYGTRTWHTNQDYYERAPEDDLKQAATIMAALVYQAAMRDARLPRREIASRASAQPVPADGR